MNMAFAPSLDQILNVMRGKGYVLYESSNTAGRTLNIVGIRRKTLTPDKFDDTLAVFNLFPSAFDFMLFPITTDPSPHYLRHPVSRNGTAILKAAQYVDTY